MTLKVLVADDHAVNRLLLRTLFESFGCTVGAVASGWDALKVQGGFDLICVDRHMPHMGGEEVASRIGQEAFVVVCTSHPADLVGPFKMVIEKPISCQAIAAVVSAARAWRLERNLGRWPSIDIRRERQRICALTASHPQIESLMAESMRLASLAAAREGPGPGRLEPDDERFAALGLREST